MKIACQHLLRRRDLSCTKVNAVNRLSECLYASFRLSKKKEAASPATTAQGPTARQWGAKKMAASLGHDKQMQLFQPGRGQGRTPGQLKKGATTAPSGSAIFLPKTESGERWVSSSFLVSEETSEGELGAALWHTTSLHNVEDRLQHGHFSSPFLNFLFLSNFCRYSSNSGPSTTCRL